MTSSRWWWVMTVAALACAVVSASMGERECLAASKEECLEAHGRGQDLREAGRLTSARLTFMACAQSTCPALIQADCARFGEELDRLVPTVSFAARDPSGADLPDTVVYVDDQQVALRLDDGKSYDLDPGKHSVRFVHDGHETSVTVVVNQGEKGRGVVATFAGVADPTRAIPSLPPAPAEPRRPIAPLVVAGLGAIATVTGGVLIGVGLAEVPSSCSVGSRQCVAAPGDPAFDQAHRGIGLANLGIGVGAAGAAVLVGGTVWYFLQPARPRRELGVLRSVSPWFGDRAGGLRVQARF
ncbi:MAG TPA: hypothetical protein VH044_12750 [Polyangiaceae bacterium]|jgi:hypothetical protein|nr:hypothetical protein [Polyangiaceae bacterium]